MHGKKDADAVREPTAGTRMNSPEAAFLMVGARRVPAENYGE
jgi:hypothetical protein